MSYPSYPPPHQPYSGDPNRPDPAHPGYPPPPEQPYSAYQQPSAPSYPGYPPPPVPPKKSSTGKILLIVLAVVLVLCCGGGAGVYLLVKDEVTDVVEATQTRLVTPDTLAGRPKSTRTSFQQIADAQVASLKRTNPGATSSISAFYGESAKKDLIMIAGVSGIVADPNRALDDMIKTLVSDLGLTNIQSIDPGPLGGNAKCGDGNMAEYPVGVCVWVDRGSLGMIFAYEQTAEEIKAEFVTIRGEVQKRG